MNLYHTDGGGWLFVVVGDRGGGAEHAGNQESFSQALEKLGGNNSELGAAFIKFSCLVKELATLLRNLVRHLSIKNQSIHGMSC